MSPSHQKGFSWLSVLLGLFILIAISGMIPLLFLKGAKSGDRTRALAKAKSIVGGLMIFKKKYGAYPCDATRKILENDGIDFLPPGKDANAYLAQLLASQILASEKTFFAPGMEAFHQGDDRIDTADTILAQGENSFAYIMTTAGKPLTDTRSYTPLVLAAVKHPGIIPIFDTKVYRDRFVCGLADGSSMVGRLDENGSALSKGRIHFFQTGKDSLFGTDFPIIKYPLQP